MENENSAFEARAASAKLSHTAGPWQSQHEFDWEGLCSIVGNIDGDPASPTFTRVCDLDEGCDEFLANRNLICAAPELYRTLKVICSEFAQQHPLIKAGMAALAKAEGK